MAAGDAALLRHERGSTAPPTARAPARAFARGSYPEAWWYPTPLLVLIAMFLVGISLWTLVPVGWLWVGSQLVDSHGPSMGAYAIVGTGIIATEILALFGLARLEHLFDHLTHARRARTPAAWRRAEGSESLGRSTRLKPTAVAIALSVLLACDAYAVWFFFFAGAPF